MSIFWSRLIVWLMFITMTFIYFFLALTEEKECLKKYPDTYKPYYEKTGMFFQKTGLHLKIPQYSIRQKSILLAKIDIKKNRIMKLISDGIKNRYGNIPVPLF